MSRLSLEGVSLSARLSKLRSEHPDHCTLAEVATILGVGRTAAFTYHCPNLPFKTVDDIRLYERKAVNDYARTRKRTGQTVLTVRGIEVERLRKICETYYRTQYDIAPQHLLRLAKKVGRL